jgi:hypothetical protein
MPEWGGQSKSVHIDKNAGIGWSTCPEFPLRNMLTTNSLKLNHTFELFKRCNFLLFNIVFCFIKLLFFSINLSLPSYTSAGVRFCKDS